MLLLQTERSLKSIDFKMHLPLNVLKEKKKCGWSFHMLVKWPIPFCVGGSWPKYGLDLMPIFYRLLSRQLCPLMLQ